MAVCLKLPTDNVCQYCQSKLTWIPWIPYGVGHLCQLLPLDIWNTVQQMGPVLLVFGVNINFSDLIVLSFVGLYFSY